MNIVSATDFKAAVIRDRKSAGDLMVRKLFTIAPEEAPDDTIRFTITTQSVDRDNDRVMLDGWLLDNYLKNPVVLWGHNSREPPVGRSLRLFRESDGLKSDVKFVPESVPIFGPRAEGIKQLCKEGFLFATSVGFRPLEWKETDDKERGAGDWFAGVDFHKQELMEFSIVTIPANPEALIEPMTAPAAPHLLPVAQAAGTPEALAAVAEAVRADIDAALQRAMRERQRRQRIADLLGA